MDFGIEFYADWFGWLEKRAPEMAAKDPVSLLALLSDISALLKAQIALWKTLGNVANGNVIAIAVKFVRWVSEHPDPLQATREQMRALRAKYGEAGAK